MRNKRDKAKAMEMEKVIVATLQEANKSLKSGPGGEESVLVTCYNCGQAGHMPWTCLKEQGNSPLRLVLSVKETTASWTALRDKGPRELSR